MLDPTGHVTKISYPQCVCGEGQSKNVNKNALIQLTVLNKDRHMAKSKTLKNWYIFGDSNKNNVVLF